MTTTSDDFNTFLEEEHQAFDATTEMICINDKSLGGLPFYLPNEFNDAFINYIYEKLSKGDLFTEPSNPLQAHLVPSAVYLDGDWYYSSGADPDTYSEIAQALATEYKERWEKELNKKCISFVFLPERFDNRKGGFHVMIFVEDNVGKPARMEIYEKIKQGFNEYIMNEFKDMLEVKTTGGIVPYKESSYEALLDKGPTMNLITLLPFAQKSAKSRRYVLDLDDSSECIREKKIPFLMKGLIYPEQRRGEVSTHEMSLTKRTISYDTAIDDIDIEDDEYELEQDEDLNQRYVEIIKRSKGFNLNVFGRKYGRLFAEFVQSLSYLSYPTHRFWEMLSDHDTRLRYIFKPFLQIVCLSYFIEYQGAVPNEEDMVLATAKLFHPLVRKTVWGASEEEFKRTNLSYVHRQVKIAYERFAHIPDIFGEKESLIYRKYKYEIDGSDSRRRKRGKREEEEEDADEENEEDAENHEEIRECQKEVVVCQSTIQDKRSACRKETLAIEKEFKQKKGMIDAEIAIIKAPNHSDDEINHHFLEMRDHNAAELKRLQELYKDEEDSVSKINEEYKVFQENEAREFEQWKSCYVQEEIRKCKARIDDLQSEANERKEKTKTTYNQLITDQQIKMADVKDKIKKLKSNLKNRKNLSDKNEFEILQEHMVNCVNDWILFVKNWIMVEMTDEIKPFERHNKQDPYAYVEYPFQNREEIDIDEVKTMNPKNLSSEPFYHMVIRTWVRHFLFATFYDSRSSDEAVYLTMTHLVKDFIYINNDDAIDELFIYNFKQTKELAEYPYNQWIVDTRDGSKGRAKIIGKRSLQWIKEIFNKFIKPEFSSTVSGKQIMALTELVGNCRKVVGKEFFTEKSLTLSGKYDSIVTDTYNNIISYVQTTYKRTPIEVGLNDGNTTFGRNGKVCFDEDGEPCYSLKDNHDTYARGVSNIIFTENYNKDNEAYQRIEKIFETTYPIKELREYIERIMASMFVGGQHAMFLIMIGAGSEGKSLFCNLITAMFGGECTGKTLYEDRKLYS